MKDRFQGPEGRRLLVETLGKCAAVEYDVPLAEALAEVVDLREHSADDFLMAQGATDNEVAFILSGEVEILVNNCRIATRGRGHHVGEMAAIEPGAPRSATVRTTKPTLAAWISEPNLTTVANCHPRLWRAFAATLAERLRERERFHRPSRMEPGVLFLSDGTPSIAVLEEQMRATFHGFVGWTANGPPSTHPADELHRRASEADFALFATTAHQGLVEPGAAFQLGLLVGALGRARVFVVCPTGAPVPPPFEGTVVLPSEDVGLVLPRVKTRMGELGPR